MALPVLSALSQVWKLARKVEDLLDLQTKTRTTLEAIDARLRTDEDRMTHLEAGQGQLIPKPWQPLEPRQRLSQDQSSPMWSRG
jgi:hypothetical protein